MDICLWTLSVPRCKKNFSLVKFEEKSEHWEDVQEKMLSFKRALISFNQLTVFSRTKETSFSVLGMTLQGVLNISQWSLEYFSCGKIL